MKKLSLVAAAALISMFAVGPVMAQDTAQCEAIFAKNDKNGDGSLGQAEAMKFEEKMHKEDLAPKDSSIIHKDEFMNACAKASSPAWNDTYCCRPSSPGGLSQARMRLIKKSRRKVARNFPPVAFVQGDSAGTIVPPLSSIDCNCRLSATP